MTAFSLSPLVGLGVVLSRNRCVYIGKAQADTDLVIKQGVILRYVMDAAPPWMCSEGRKKDDGQQNRRRCVGF